MCSNGVKYNLISKLIGLNFLTFAAEKKECKSEMANKTIFQAHLL